MLRREQQVWQAEHVGLSRVSTGHVQGYQPMQKADTDSTLYADCL